MREYGRRHAERLVHSGHVLNGKYLEILKLDTMLDEAGIYHELMRYFDGWQIAFYGKHAEEKIGDVIEHYGSYGHEEDRMEIMGAGTTDGLDVEGHLDAETVFERWKKIWEEETR